MFSYVLNEHISKAVDFFKLNGSNSNKSTNQPTCTTSTTSRAATTTTDLNNNNTTVAAKTYSSTQTATTSLLDEYDWFKPKHNDQDHQQQANSLGSDNNDSYYIVDRQTHQSLSSNKESVGPGGVVEDYHEQILISLYHENLIKQYSVNSASRKRRLAAQRKMTSFFNKLSINPDRLDDELKSFLEKNKSSSSLNNNNKRQSVISGGGSQTTATTNTLYDEPSLADNSLLKPVRLFQKAYYKEKIRGELVLVPSWRMKEKMKTISAALVMCLNIGVDPPDVVRPANCSRMECWINTTAAQPSRSLELVGAELQRQYERWQPRARYKHCLDPTLEDVRKLCISLRKNAKDERVLFHYNGHGVPRPTANGEIWVFNKEFTQYIPLSLYEVLTWMSSPSIYVWDCANAELVIQSFIQFEKDRETELLKSEMNPGSVKIDHQTTTAGGVAAPPPHTIPMPNSNNQNQNIRIRDSIHLGACGSNESLPAHPDLPMDIFTACLTTPIKAALYWYVSHKKLAKLVPGLTLDLLDKIPGTISDRRTMLGELNWIFTAITDTIAWNVLDSDLFQKLFRQDLLVASLFRNFLLAERIMKSLDCTPVSHPALPSTHEHPLWQAWDLALDMCITQLPQVVNNNNNGNSITTTKDFVSCGFFTEQIEIFDAWLKYNVSSSTPPEQLPIVLQILLSQQHRLKALELLAKFLDFGAWAVSAALSVGIFPYVLKLITTQPKELRPLLTFIWAKILAVDKSCQAELAKDNGHTYFIHVLSDPDVEPVYKIYSTFVLARLVDNYPTGKEFARQNHLISTCHGLLTDKQSRDYRSALLRQWCCLCLGLCWQNYPEARWEGVRNNAHQNLIELIGDEVPEVRAAAIFALGTYIGCGPGNEADLEQTSKIDSEIVNAMIRKYDIVYLVRRELIVALYNYMSQFLTNTTTTTTTINNNSNSPGLESSESSTTISSGIGTMSLSSGQPMSKTSSSVSLNQLLMPGRVQSPPTPSVMSALGRGGGSGGGGGGSILSSNKSVNNLFSKVWLLLLDTQNDPYPSVADLTRQVVAYLLGQASQFDLVKQNLVHQAVSQYRAKMINRVSSDLHHEIFPPVCKPCHKLELNTEFTAWCSNYFLKPLLPTEKQQQSQQRPSSSSTTSQIDLFNSETLDHYCRLLYNYKRKKQPAKWVETASQQTMSVSASFKHSSQIKHCKFHPYENQLCVADDECLITIYDLNTNLPQPHSGNDRKLSSTSINSTTTTTASNGGAAVVTPAKLIQFANSSVNTKRATHRITSMNLINVKHEPIVLTGTYDRVVRFWKPTDLNNNNKSSSSSVNLITAFQAYSDSEKRESNFESGLIMEWDEASEHLVCAGDTTFIRVWDMSKELYRDYPTQVASCVFSLSTSENYTVAGFGEGTVKVFDFRQPHSAGAALTTSTTSTTRPLKPMIPTSSSSSSLNNNSTVSGNLTANFYSANVYKHESFVRRVQLHKSSNRLITAGASGDINIFDMRNMQNVLKESINNEPVFAVECHPINELIAAANGVSQTVKIYDLRGKELTCVKYLDSFVGKRIPPINCLDWNMFKNELALGTQDSYVTLLSTK